MITKDEITMYICSYALFSKETLMFRYTHINTCSTNWMLPNTHMNANIYLVIHSFGTLFHGKIFSLTVSNIPDISLTCFKFPDISRFSRQVVTLGFASQTKCKQTPAWKIRSVTESHDKLQTLLRWHHSSSLSAYQTRQNGSEHSFDRETSPKTAQCSQTGCQVKIQGDASKRGTYMLSMDICSIVVSETICNN